MYGIEEFLLWASINKSETPPPADSPANTTAVSVVLFTYVRTTCAFGTLIV